MYYFIYFQRDIVIRHGYPFESYSVTTEDGYILNLFRIPPPIGSESNAQPVFLQHGIATSSVVWVDIGDRSLGMSKLHIFGNLVYLPKNIFYYNYSLPIS